MAVTKFESTMMRLLLQDNFRLNQAALKAILDAIDNGEDSFTADHLLNLMAVDVLKLRQEQNIIDKQQRHHEALVDFVENVVPEDIELEQAQKIIEKQLKKAVWPEKVDTEANPEVAVTGDTKLDLDDYWDDIVSATPVAPVRLPRKKGKK